MAITSLLNTTRLTGLSSGMDTDTIVKNLMKIEQLKMNRELRAKTTLQWRQDALKSVATDMKSFQRTFLTTLGKDGMLTSATYTSFNVSVSGSKKDAVSITANAEAAMRKVTVNKITQLASAASVKSANKVSKSGTELSEGNYVKLGDLEFANDLFVGTKTIQVPVQKQATTSDGYEIFEDKANNRLVYQDADGVYRDFKDDSAISLSAEEAAALEIAYATDSKGNPIYETKPKTNAAGEAMFHDQDGKVYYQSLGNPAEYKDKDGNIVDVTGKTLTAVSEIVTEEKVVPDDTIEFYINGEKFTFTKETTLAQMFSTINNSKANVSISYSRLTDSFTISSKETGKDSTLTIDNLRGNAFGAGSAFGIGEYGAMEAVLDGNGDPLLDAEGNTVTQLQAGSAAALKGENAVLYIENTRVERSSNSFYIDGIGYTLNFKTGDEQVDASGNPLPVANQIFDDEIAITANLTQNIDASVDKIKGFVEGYNTMINKLYNLTIEGKNSKYYALTDEEKSTMTESQINEWEALAKSGLLRNDRDIQNVLSRLREAFYTAVEGVGLSAQDIGLRTAYNSRSGEIQLNEVDLRAALAKDSDAVMRVFMNDGGDEFKSNGLLYRLNNILDTYTKETQYNTMSNLDKDMYKLNKKIDDMEARLAKIEEKYYLKYAAMETALSKLNAQSDWLSSMLGSMSK